MSSPRKWLVVAVCIAAVGAFSVIHHQPLARQPVRVSTSLAPTTDRATPRDSSRPTRTMERPKVRGVAIRKKEPAAEFHLGNQIPVGWVVRRLADPPALETRFSFRVPNHPGIEPGLHFHPFTTPVFFWSQDVRSWLGEIAAAKEAQRTREGFLDYHNRPEMTPRVIGNRAALSWAADFVRNGEPWVENLTRVFSPSGTALFFVQAPAAEIQDIQPSFDIIIETSVLPTLAKSEEGPSSY